MANKRFGWHSGDIEAREAIALKANIPQVVTLGLPQVVADESFPYEVTTNTEQAAAYCKVYDLSALAYINLNVSATGGGYAANYQMFPGTEAIGDMVYFGAAAKFGCLYFDMSATVQTYTNDSLTWEYWNGSGWIAFTPYDTTDGTAQDGKRSFGSDGYVFIHAPNWKDCEVDSQGGYWVRCKVTAAAINQTGLTESKEHHVVSSTGSRVHTKGNISKGCFKFGTVSGSSNNTKFIVANLSKGYFDAIDLVKAVANQEITMDIDIEDGDYIAWYAYEIDTGTEFQNGTVELYIDKR